ncbi:hypothetical protein PW23_001178 [Salmonella enterica subsp. enterica serovar Anatum]|nr:hypothetical protein [Salmonella enterica subsp. enterica serovar Anatum]
MRCGGASVVLSEQPPAFAGYPPDRPDPPLISVHVLLVVNKWPERARQNVRGVCNILISGA